MCFGGWERGLGEKVDDRRSEGDPVRLAHCQEAIEGGQCGWSQGNESVVAGKVRGVLVRKGVMQKI